MLLASCKCKGKGSEGEIRLDWVAFLWLFEWNHGHADEEHNDVLR
jgi:hypothetical protein